MGQRVKREYDASRRQADAERTRCHVVDAATPLFIDAGYESASMRQIADAADVSLQTLYNAFGSKYGLFTAVMDVVIAGDHEPVALADRPAGATAGATAWQSSDEDPAGGRRLIVGEAVLGVVVIIVVAVNVLTGESDDSLGAPPAVTTAPRSSSSIPSSVVRCRGRPASGRTDRLVGQRGRVVERLSRDPSVRRRE